MFCIYYIRLYQCLPFEAIIHCCSSPTSSAIGASLWHFLCQAFIPPVCFFVEQHTHSLKIALKGVEISYFSSTIIQKTAVHRFFPPGLPDDIEAVFSPENKHFFWTPKGGDVVAVFRIEEPSDYTVMSNHHLRNAGLLLKSKSLLSMILFLPED